MSSQKKSTKLAGLSALALAAALCAIVQPGAANAAPAASAEDQNTSLTVSLGKEVGGAPAKRKITVPNVGEFLVLKGDFHIHTLFSDGAVMPRQRVMEAADNGFDVIAITDHIEYHPNIGKGELKLAENNNDCNMPYKLAKPEADKQKVLLVRGAEVTKAEWHFNVLFVKDVNAIAAEVNDWQAMLAVAAGQGGFVQWNHPNWIDRTPDQAPFGLKKGEPMRFFNEIEEIRAKGHLHAIEVFSNSGCMYNPIAHDWCNDHDLAVMANTDLHPSELDRFGRQNPLRPMTLVLAKERTLASVREAFFAKRTLGWAANRIFGRDPWAEKLFRSCVDIKKNGTGLTLRNLSDIHCVIEADGQTSELPPQGSVDIALTKKLTVSNWFVGAFKPLGIVLQAD